jgi:hypothetical protein
MNMKRTGLWAMGLGVLVGVGLLTVEQGYADDATKCTLATLKGRYLFAATGTLLPSAAGEEPTLVSVAGYHIFNGDGTGQDFVTGLRDGIVLPETSPTPVTYTLNSDCTGTYTVLPSGPHFDIFVSPDGDQLAVIGTDPGVVLAEGPNTRVSRK